MARAILLVCFTACVIAWVVSSRYRAVQDEASLWGDQAVSGTLNNSERHHSHESSPGDGYEAFGIDQSGESSSEDLSVTNDDLLPDSQDESNHLNAGVDGTATSKIAGPYVGPKGAVGSARDPRQSVVAWSMKGIPYPVPDAVAETCPG
jgi:hypothetical protein